jgi:hypothetical protein
LALACALGKPPFGLPLLALILARRLWPVALRGVALFVAARLPIVIWLSINAGSLASVWRAMVHNLRYTDHNPLDAPGSSGRIDALSLPVTRTVTWVAPPKWVRSWSSWV